MQRANTIVLAWASSKQCNVLKGEHFMIFRHSNAVIKDLISIPPWREALNGSKLHLQYRSATHPYTNDALYRLDSEIL